MSHMAEFISSGMAVVPASERFYTQFKVLAPDAKLVRASEATFVPAVDFHVTAPRRGYMTEADSIAAAEASEAEDSK